MSRRTLAAPETLELPAGLAQIDLKGVNLSNSSGKVAVKYHTISLLSREFWELSQGVLRLRSIETTDKNQLRSRDKSSSLFWFHLALFQRS